MSLLTLKFCIAKDHEVSAHTVICLSSSYSEEMVGILFRNDNASMQQKAGKKEMVGILFGKDNASMQQKYEQLYQRKLRNDNVL